MPHADTTRRSRDQDGTERWLSLAASAALGLLALRARPGTQRRLLATAGAALGIHGLRSEATRERLRHAFASPPPVRIHATIVVSRPVDDVFAFCADPTNLGLVLRSVERIERLADGYQRLHLHGARGPRMKCDLEITEDQENVNLLSWRTRPDAIVEVQGFLSCRRGEDDAQTEVRVSLSCAPPMGLLGHVLARAAAPVASQVVADATRRLKQVLEAKTPPALARGAAGPRARSVEEDIEHRFRQQTDGEGRVLH